MTAAHGTDGCHAMADVADAAATAAAHAAITDALGPGTVLVNNAGIMAQEVRPFHEQPIEHFDRMLAIHLRGTALLSVLCVPARREVGFGRIVNLSSVLGLVGLPYRLGYGVAKTAIIGLTRSLAMENARFGITETRSHRATSRPTPTSSGRPAVCSTSTSTPSARRSAAGVARRRSPGSSPSSPIPRPASSSAPCSRSTAATPRAAPWRGSRPAAGVSHRKAPDEGGPGLWLLAENGLDVARAMEHAHDFNRVVDDAIEDDVALNREAA